MIYSKRSLAPHYQWPMPKVNRVGYLTNEHCAGMVKELTLGSMKDDAAAAETRKEGQWDGEKNAALRNQNGAANTSCTQGI
mmetsp:Transcript_62175/g.103318  ORF Transcript_62175/g.103318 Transcript_62175/m.103318 type:complete len:81 (+) Transcript_62175:910-1152(+)|eukprot:CAMPEP_0119335692 /NCGR_PEP_ID=MMETSP1333-20130426/90084_1 /TAXON_ID=418940 /ORGANISM="Scyphosphaera apsteinii, Strain RCC1455" /LENGTH=80 /DNA_ID=CAMNT_0007346301 /DNA_START=903 /DNA_END=1145 /DNA_ORIENTATION=-